MQFYPDGTIRVGALSVWRVRFFPNRPNCIFPTTTQPAHSQSFDANKNRNQLAFSPVLVFNKSPPSGNSFMDTRTGMVFNHAALR
jgi:hypothetical protein